MKHSATAATELLLERQCAGRALAGTSAMAVVGQVPASSRHLRRQHLPRVDQLHDVRKIDGESLPEPNWTPAAGALQAGAVRSLFRWQRAASE